MITEFGPLDLGNWTKGNWGALVEENSHQKAKRYQKAYLRNE